MANFSKLSLLFIFAVGFFPSRAFAIPEEFLGTWENTDPKTRGVVRIIIDDNSKGRINLFGACHPTPCEFGRVDLVTYGENVSDSKHRVGTAHFPASFKDEEVVLKIQENKTLQLQTFTKFTDSSDRENYSQTEIFQKVSGTGKEP